MTRRSHHDRIRVESDEPGISRRNQSKAEYQAARKKAERTMFGPRIATTMRFNRGVQLGCINWPIEIPENVEVTKCPTVYAWGVQLR
jgi:hypothetical protein